MVSATTTHVFTHHKAGSTWLRRTIRAYCSEKGLGYSVEPETTGKMNAALPSHDGQHVAVYRGGDAKFLERMQPGEKGVHLVRDPRDAFISQFWSWRESHANNDQAILTAREALRAVDVDEGLRLMLDRFQVRLVAQLRGWDSPAPDGFVLVRYEDLLADFTTVFGGMLQFCGLPYDAALVERIRDDYSFSKLTRRKEGEQDVSSHLRKGVAGDWRNYFDDDLKAAFKAKYGSWVVWLGYEANDEW